MTKLQRGVGLVLLAYLAASIWFTFPLANAAPLGGLWFAGIQPRPSLLGLAPSLACAALALLVLRRPRPVLASGLLLWSASDILRFLAPAPFFSINLLALLGYPLLAWCILQRFPGLFGARMELRQVGRVGTALDAGITVVALTSLTGMVMLSPVLGGNVPPRAPEMVFWSFFFPLGDIALAFLAFHALLANGDRTYQGLGWWAGGFLLFFLADITHSYELLGGVPLDNLWELGWPLGYGMFLMALPAEAVRPARSPAPATRLRYWLQRMLPVAATIVLGWYIAIVWQLTGQISSLAATLTGILAALLVLRQGIAAGELELQEYAMLVNHVVEPAFICDDAGRIRLANPALARLLKVDDLADLLNQPLGLFFTGPAHWVETTQPVDLTLERTDGTRVPVQMSLITLQATSRARHRLLAGTLHNLTSQRQQQAILEQARQALQNMNAQLEAKVAEKTSDLSQALARLEEQNRTLQKLDELKSDFVSLVSHDLRAPLTNISGGIELALSANNLPPSTHQVLELVQNEISRLSNFVETILDLSALDAGHLPFYPAPVDLIGLVQGLRRQMATHPGSDRLRWELPPTPVPPVLADEQALTSVFLLLIDNALKYAPHGAVTVQVWPQENRMLVSVRDEGPGIPAAAFPRLFQMFSRGHSSDSQTVYGHGLGLYMVRRLLGAMQGDIHAENRPEGGACFTFWIPVVEENDEPEDSLSR